MVVIIIVSGSGFALGCVVGYLAGRHKAKVCK